MVVFSDNLERVIETSVSLCLLLQACETHCLAPYADGLLQSGVEHLLDRLVVLACLVLLFDGLCLHGLCDLWPKVLPPSLRAPRKPAVLQPTDSLLAVSHRRSLLPMPRGSPGR